MTIVIPGKLHTTHICMYGTTMVKQDANILFSVCKGTTYVLVSKVSTSVPFVAVMQGGRVLRKYVCTNHAASCESEEPELYILRRHIDTLLNYYIHAKESTLFSRKS